MKFKRILAVVFALALTLPLLIPWAHAHPGRTDANGGHTDTDTGDYHYHHGYEAHAHFDIDGNGTIDCPFDFVNKTGQNSGTRSSGTSTPGDGSEDGYQEGYADGYEKGELDGWTDAFTTSAATFNEEIARLEADYEEQLLQAEAEHSEELRSYLVPLLWACALFALLFFGSVFLSRSADKQFAAKLRQAEANSARSIERLTVDYSAQISKLREEHAAEVRRLKRRLVNFKRLEVLERIAQGKDDSLQLPDGVALRPSYTPIRGSTSKYYPYGSYTVFVSQISKVYHCKHNCSSVARPSHFFDLPDKSVPCSRCVPSDMFPQPLPDWYIKLRDKIDAINSDSDPHHESDRTTGDSSNNPQIQFSIRTPPTEP